MIARLLFRASLLLYPRAFRRRFEEGMVETFLLGVEEHRRRGRLPAIGYVLRTLPNVAFTGLRERSHPTMPASTGRRPRMRQWPLDALRETKYAVRSFLKRPGFTLLAVSTLALGVGANTAILSVVNGVLLEPLPYPEPEALVSVMSEWAGPDAGIGPMSYPDLADIEAKTVSIEALVGVSPGSMTLTGLGEPVVTEVFRVTKGLLELLGVAPLLGRDIEADEFGANGPAVAVVSEAFWQSRLGGVEDVLGRTFFLDGISYEIVGVAPSGVTYPLGAEIWIPRRIELESCGRGCHTMRAVGRLSPGGTLDEARAEIGALAASLAAEYPDTNTHKSFLVQSLKDRLVGDVRQGLLLLLGAVSLVVLIACANVANLLLVRASTRTNEIAIRSAMGASRTRLVAQSLVESGTLALLGGAAGLGLALGALAVLPRLAPDLPRLDSVGIDATVLGLTLVLLVAVTLLFGAAPALALSQAAARSASMTDSRGRRRFKSALLAMETALAALLLVGAGLLLKSFFALYAVDLGFEPRNLSRFSVKIPEVRYDSIEKVRGFFRELEVRIAALPGVESVGSVWSAPLESAHSTGTALVTGRPKPSPAEEREASIHPVGPGFLETMRMRIVAGRGLLPRDDVGPEPVGVVNETFATTIFPGEDPIGREVRVTVDMGYGSPSWRIVGVVADVRGRTLEDEPSAQIYVPHGLFGPERMTVTVRAPENLALVPAVREIVRDMDPEVPLYRIETVLQAVEREVAPTRFYFLLLGVFAAMAVALAAVGIYGVVAYAAASRTREIGLRLALGAARSDVLALVVRQGMTPAALGLAFGLLAAGAAGRVVEAMLYRVEPSDPAVYAGVAMLLAVVAFAATLVPARRASRVDPARALRAE